MDDLTGPPKISAVCQYCRHHNSEPVMEINFRDRMIYYICPNCEKENKLKLKPELQPLPKLRTSR
tara:strand:+ start:1908 stop:2102 length:195 start_codon:yes stop_codon:yes gene_type:complete